MSCAICGKPTLIGARLCGPCRSALKRAKDNTVFDLPPALLASADSRAPAASGRDGGPTPPATQSHPAAHAAAVPLPVRRNLRGLRTLGVGLLCAAAFGATAVRLVTFDAVLPAPVTTPGERGAVLALAGEGTALDLSQRQSGAGDVTAGAANGVTRAATTPEGALPAAIAPKTERPPQPGAAPYVARPGPDPSSRHGLRTPRAEPEPVAEPAPPPMPAPKAERAPLVVASAAPRVAAVPANPWQRLDAALAECASETLFARIACEHRARAKYCEGRWGDAAHCPSGVPTDHGQ
jgi:hypothetical protein